MAMFTLLLKETKDLIISVDAKIYQKESYIQALQVLVPEKINDIDLTPFSVTLEYVDPSNNAHAETLVRDPIDELYKEQYLRYILPIDSKFTFMAGTVKMTLSMLHIDQSTSTQYVLHTNTIKKEILTWQDFWAFVPDTTISKIDQKMLELDNKIQEVETLAQNLEANAAADLEAKDDNLHLINGDGNQIGSGVEVSSVPADDIDGINDGIIHIVNL